MPGTQYAFAGRELPFQRRFRLAAVTGGLPTDQRARITNVGSDRRPAMSNLLCMSVDSGTCRWEPFGFRRGVAQLLRRASKQSLRFSDGTFAAQKTEPALTGSALFTNQQASRRHPLGMTGAGRAGLGPLVAGQFTLTTGLPFQATRKSCGSTGRPLNSSSSSGAGRRRPDGAGR